MKITMELKTFFFLSALHISSSEDTVLVNLPEGALQGALEKSHLGQNFYSFYGIPYALPPIGKRRFMRPEPVESWESVKGGEIIECAQEETGSENFFNMGVKLRGVEDCLVLNIYTPSLGKGDYPVMVFVHGGGYFAGSGSPGVYGPEYLMDHGVILVTVNYRLGPLGFLSLGDEVLSGNQGLWDMVLAVQFIHKRIAQFGGNPDKITLFGHSAGSMVVQLLMMTKHVSGLFRAAILQSGPILSAFAHSDKNPAFYARTFSSSVGCDPQSNSSQILDCLQHLDVENIVSNVRVFDHEDNVMKNAPQPWKPIFDGHFLSSHQAFLVADPLDLLESGNFSDIPVMIGQTKDEGLYAISDIIARTPNAVDIVFDDWPHKKGPSYIFGREEDEINDIDIELAEEFLKVFLEDGATRDPHILQNWFLHSVWTAATVRTTELLAEGKQSPTYQYYYTHPGSLSLSDLLSYPLWKLVLKLLASKVNLDLFPNSLNGATHFDEIFLLFNGRNIPFLQRHTSSDISVSDTLLKIWTNFAKTTIPAIDYNDSNLTWESFSDTNRRHLEIGTNSVQMKNSDIFEPAVQFWKKVWEKVPPRIHLWRSETWTNSSIYTDIYKPIAGREL